MKTVGIVAEYNPCHKGHIYHIEQSKIQSKSTCTVVVMSGNYVQRGGPAIADKYLRSKWALLSGADLILEIPTVYACASAEYFAKGAVSLLDQIGMIDSISFGMESGEISEFRELVALLQEEPKEYTFLYKNKLQMGLSAPLARVEALKEYFHRTSQDPQSLDHILTPNNILAIEYLKALKDQHSSIQPLGIQRNGSQYHDQHFTGRYPSATAVRNMMTAKEFESIQESVAPEVSQLMLQEYDKTYPVMTNDFSQLLFYALLEKESHLEDYLDVDVNLANSIRKALRNGIPYSFEEWIKVLKNKHLTYTRISRGLTHILLDIHTRDLVEYGQHGHAQYARVLGFSPLGRDFLNQIRKTSRIPFLTKVGDAEEKLSSLGNRMFHTDLLGSRLYQSVVATKYGTTIPDEYRSRPIM